MFVECKLCKKELKSKISKERGYGPECWQKHLADMPKKQILGSAIDNAFQVSTAGRRR